MNTEELRKRIDEILFWVWDPIGISTECATRGEYEIYVPKILELVLSNEKPEPIADALREIAETKIGFDSTDESRKHDLKVAELLLEHKFAVEHGLK